MPLGCGGCSRGLQYYPIRLTDAFVLNHGQLFLEKLLYTSYRQYEIGISDAGHMVLDHVAKHERPRPFLGIIIGLLSREYHFTARWNMRLLNAIASSGGHVYFVAERGRRRHGGGRLTGYRPHVIPVRPDTSGIARMDVALQHNAE